MEKLEAEAMTIELRLTDIDPPTAEPKRTIYRDIANLPDPTTLGITIRYFNYDDVGLYMQITGSGTGYTFTPANLGLLGTGANAYKNLDNFASRTKPTVAQLPNGEMSENITLTLKGYTDAGYTNLKWTFNRVVTVIWINSTDASFTVNEVDNFDDGTVQGWAVVNESQSISLSVAPQTDYVLSPPYSLRVTEGSSNIGSPCQNFQTRYRLYKSFTTPNKDKVYAVMDIRIGRAVSGGEKYFKNYTLKKDSDVLVYLGKAYDTAASDYIPVAKWVRIVVPLPKNTTLELRMVLEHVYHRSDSGSMYAYSLFWMDDFKIISK